MNSLKHSGASTVTITLEPKEDVVELRISDDGIGFDAEGPGPEGHFGLTMMRERAQVAGGTFTVESMPGEGTTIRARFPTSWLDEEAGPPEDTDAPTSLTEPPPARAIKSELLRPSAPSASESTGQAVPA